MKQQECKSFAVVIGPSFDEAMHQIKASQAHADGIELRFDILHHFSKKQWQDLLTQNTLLTMATRHQESDFVWNFDYIDVEYHQKIDNMLTIKKLYPSSQIILSYHNWDETPDLDPLFEKMVQRKADAYKVATMARSREDADRMLTWITRANQKGYRIIGICMGTLGQKTRIIGPTCGSCIEYLAVDSQHIVAPGQRILNPASLKDS